MAVRGLLYAVKVYKEVRRVSEKSVITGEIKKLLNKETEPVVYHIDSQWLKRFAEAMDDPNPLWQDEEYAGQTRYGGVIAPPTFPCSLRCDALRKQLAEMDHPLKKLVNASSELELFKPIRVGDTITVTDKLVDATEREGSKGKMLVLTNEVTYKNQFGEVVAISRESAIRF